jgi:2-polyprenyl-3-methyl-5-hydroxy-6-metoxy-1,4-benzoquinol methylase
MNNQMKSALESENGLDLNNFYSSTECPVCGSKSSLIDSVNTINPFSRKKFHLMECCSCYHWWINPTPTQKFLNSLYQIASPYVVERNEATFSQIVQILSIPERRVFNHELKINEDLSKLNYLEVGIGDGNLFSAFQKTGANCIGVEPGDSANKFENIFRDITELPVDIKYDVIVANDVLEHLEQPKDFLDMFASVSHSKSRLYCSFPNKSSIRAFFQRGKWRMVRPIGHLHYFSKESLKLLFESTDWKILKLQKTDLFDFSAIDIRKNPIENLVRGSIELLNLGDQWIVRAMPDKDIFK